jgi:alcohol dehydrogenase
MRAAVAPAVGRKWELREVARPKPAPNEVLIRVRASGICYTDVHQTNGIIPGDFPRILGHEGVGEIVEVGSAVTTRRVGDRVGVPWFQASCGRCEWCHRGKAQFCAEAAGTSGKMQGAHAEFMPALAGATALLPEALSYEQAAPIFCAGYTVWSGLRAAEPRPHERIAVVGIGGLGHLAVQYAKAAGFETIAVTHSRDKEKLARELGADEVVAGGEDLLRAGGADVILATSNSYRATEDALKALRAEGRLVLMGVAADTLGVPRDILMKRNRIIGSGQDGPEFLYEALDYAAKGKVRAVIETYPFEEITRAYDRVADGQVRFRAVIAIG